MTKYFIGARHDTDYGDYDEVFEADSLWALVWTLLWWCLRHPIESLTSGE